jgi:hypothetical protein
MRLNEAREREIAEKLQIELTGNLTSQDAYNKIMAQIKLAKSLIGPDGELIVEYGKIQRIKGEPKPGGRLGRRLREQIKDKSYSERHNTDILARARARNGARLKKFREKN